MPMSATCRRRWGGNVVMHWEDVGSEHSYELLQRLKAGGEWVGCNSHWVTEAWQTSGCIHGKLPVEHAGERNNDV